MASGLKPLALGWWEECCTTVPRFFFLLLLQPWLSLLKINFIENSWKLKGKRKRRDRDYSHGLCILKKDIKVENTTAGTNVHREIG
jgi:hypothetical protein